MQPGQPTYEQQWQKITSAYSNDELEPYMSCACFIGNLLNRNWEWGRIRSGMAWCGKAYVDNTYVHFNEGISFLNKETNSLYTPQNIVDLENNFLSIIYLLTGSPTSKLLEDISMSNWAKNHPNYESALYEAMTSTLELLRQIHLKHNDETAIEIPLKKRELCTS